MLAKREKRPPVYAKEDEMLEKPPPIVVVDRIRFRAEPLAQNAVVTSSVPATFTPQQCSIEVPGQTCQRLLPNLAYSNLVQPRPTYPSEVSTCPPVSPASNATQFYATRPPPIGNLPGSFLLSQPPVTVNPASSLVPPASSATQFYVTPSPSIGNLPESSVPRSQPLIAVNPASSPASLASNATQFYVTPPPPPATYQEAFQGLNHLLLSTRDRRIQQVLRSVSYSSATSRPFACALVVPSR